jgi:predicted nucleic acid-binding protein
MVLVDTSVWINHLRDGLPGLEELLATGQVACHPFIIGEVACGHLINRVEILTALARLPSTPVVDHGEALFLLERYELMGRGIGWVDVHLIASALLSQLHIWTADKRFAQACEALRINHSL